MKWKQLVLILHFQTILFKISKCYSLFLNQAIKYSRMTLLIVQSLNLYNVYEYRLSLLYILQN